MCDHFRFGDIVELLREAKESEWKIGQSGLRDLNQVVEKNIHARLLGLVALPSFKQGFRVESEAKWPLTIGNRNARTH